MSGKGTQVTVRRGDTTEGIAFKSGLFWQTVWNHPENAALKALRKNPNVLLEGDVLFVPDIETREDVCATTRTHTFRLKGVPSRFSVRYLDLIGNPRAHEPYVIRGNGVEQSGTLDGDGWLRLLMMPDVRAVDIVLSEGTELETHYAVGVGALDPIAALSGVCQRLQNLGYYDGPALAQQDAALDRAVGRFREDAGLEPGTDVDDAVRSALEKQHGS